MAPEYLDSGSRNPWLDGTNSRFSFACQLEHHENLRHFLLVENPWVEILRHSWRDKRLAAILYLWNLILSHELQIGLFRHRFSFQNICIFPISLLGFVGWLMHLYIFHLSKTIGNFSNSNCLGSCHFLERWWLVDRVCSIVRFDQSVRHNFAKSLGGWTSSFMLLWCWCRPDAARAWVNRCLSPVKLGL